MIFLATFSCVVGVNSNLTTNFLFVFTLYSWEKKVYLFSETWHINPFHSVSIQLLIFHTFFIMTTGNFFIINFTPLNAFICFICLSTINKQWMMHKIKRLLVGQKWWFCDKWSKKNGKKFFGKNIESTNSDFASFQTAPA